MSHPSSWGINLTLALVVHLSIFYNHLLMRFVSPSWAWLLFEVSNLQILQFTKCVLTSLLSSAPPTPLWWLYLHLPTQSSNSPPGFPRLPIAEKDPWLLPPAFSLFLAVLGRSGPCKALPFQKALPAEPRLTLYSPFPSLFLLLAFYYYYYF